MPHISRIVPRDEELGKRDDNYRPAKKGSTAWMSGSGPAPWRRRRLLWAAMGLIGLYLFIHNIPTDLGSIDERMGRPLRPGHVVGGTPFGYNPPSGGTSRTEPKDSPRMPTGPPPRSQEVYKSSKGADQEEHYYAGPIKFYKLASTLYKLQKIGGQKPVNRNVLFAASSLKSAANLIPMACEMTKTGKNNVNMVLLGRDALPLADILEMNSVSLNDCPIYFHDARADYAEYSTDVRAEVAVVGAMRHVQKYMHPQAVIIDDSAEEDAFFVKGIRGILKESNKQPIEVPKGKYEDFLWMTRLSSDSLAAWHKISIEVFVHVPPGSAGGLIRLLKSLAAADFSGLHPPHLTIELPPQVDPFVKIFLEDFKWPPHTSGLAPRQNFLQLHHRIPSGKSSTEASSVRFLESFYPADDDSHILLLSSQAEVSPLFYHYLTYNLLEYYYSGAGTGERDHMFGLGLATPQTYLDGKLSFLLPQQRDLRSKGLKLNDIGIESMPFLWQAPDADAALVFGNKWKEMHNYLTNRLRITHAGHSIPKQEKLIAETQPSWMEFMLELIRARNWLMLVPAQSSAGRWATVHNELYQVPEEFKHRKSSSKDEAGNVQDMVPEIEEPFLRGEETPTAPSQQERPVVQHTQPLHALLPFEKDLPELPDLPVLDFEGTVSDMSPMGMRAGVYSAILRKTVGGCDPQDAERPRKVFIGRTDDLFCFEDEEARYADLDIKEPPDVIVGELTAPKLPDLPTLPTTTSDITAPTGVD